MSIVLPKELQTRKVKSLPDKDRKLVEELLAEKFDIREEVVPKRDDYFRQEYSGSIERQGFVGVSRKDFFIDPTDGSYGRNGITFGVDPETRSRLARAKISLRGNPELGVLEARRNLDNNNVPSRVRKIYIHRDRLHYLMRDQRMGVKIDTFNKVTEYYGYEIIIIPSHLEEYIEASF